jgi:hypothetical protein
VSAYDNDPRVRKVGQDAFYVTCRPGSPAGRVMRVSGGRFEAATEPDRLDNPTFANADDAIRSLIGDPHA